VELVSAHIVSYHTKFLPELREIFFESSTKKEFKDASEKEAFFEKYVGYYLKNYPELVRLYVTDKVLGYIVASLDSRALDLWKLQPHMETFKAYFEEYPAHLHINCHYESRGMGVGSQLMEEVEKELKVRNIKGLHIMTGVNSPNQNFYKKLGYTFQVELNFHGSLILLMGKSLSKN
jgi:ribosomal protein S18 acetylase RimI-like enzyme